MSEEPASDHENGRDTIDEIISQADEDELLGREHTDVLRALAHVLLTSPPSTAERLQRRLETLSDISVSGHEREQAA
ncbi:hypothetical protein GGP89_001152 [Salinibacter ruber]|uniref:Uncharacterized protein n=1 Tax=Salinibacter ruber TaxID=146919 RepID=A0A9X2R6W3_9BACT|nr:hypothetical protein [Salinibacter ruber]MCS3857778.1 hypothetical protein [Salinibacter ruber]MCS3864604.1 hypothetical protein [Salinibacter ruber]